MSWLTNFVRPKIRALVGKTDVPENLWLKCANCEQMLFYRELATNLYVCNYCNHHLRMGVVERLEMLFDDGASTRIPVPETPTDPLKFRDSKRYTDRLKDAQTKTDEAEAIVIAHGAIGGHAVVIAAFNFKFMGGSMGIAVGSALVAAASEAVAHSAALIVVPASGGARMQEGILSLVQMPRTVIAVEQVREAGLPYIVLLTDPTTGGVTASFAMLGDIHIAEPGATIGFAGRRVIQDTIREDLPDQFQSAEHLREHGMVDLVVARAELRPTLIRLIGLLRTPRTDIAETAAPASPAGDDDGAHADA